MRKSLLIAAVMIAALIPFGGTAIADRNYHSQHIELVPVADAPLRSGFVENIHASGPQVFAHEIYVLNGAEPESTYEVVLAIYAEDPSCSSTPIPVATSSLTTNAAGNARSDALFHPADVPEFLRNGTHGVVWQIQSDGVAVYESSCMTIAID